MKQIPSIFMALTLVLGVSNLSAFAGGETGTLTEKSTGLTTGTMDRIEKLTKLILRDEYQQQEVFGRTEYRSPDKLNDYRPGGVPSEMQGTVYYYSQKFLFARRRFMSTPDYIKTDVPGTITAFLPTDGFLEMRDKMLEDIYSLGVELAQQYAISEALFISPDRAERCAYIYFKLRNLYRINEDVKCFIDRYQLYVKLNHMCSDVADPQKTFFLIVENNHSANGETHFGVRIMHTNDIYA